MGLIQVHMPPAQFFHPSRPLNSTAPWQVYGGVIVRNCTKLPPLLSIHKQPITLFPSASGVASHRALLATHRCLHRHPTGRPMATVIVIGISWWEGFRNFIPPDDQLGV